MKRYTLGLATLLFSFGVFADSNEDYKQQMCVKVEQCELGRLAAPDMPPFLQDVIVQTVNTQCLTIATSYEDQIIKADLQEEAKLCVHSLEDQSCSELLATQGEPNTEECNEFLKQAEAAGIDFANIQF